MSVRKSVALGICLAVLVAILIAGILPGSSKERSPIPSTYSAHPCGCKALYLVLDELRLPADRLRTSYSRLKGEHGVLMVIDAQKVRYSRREIAKLKEWIRKGNRLVLFQGPARRLSRQPDHEATAKGKDEPERASVTVRAPSRPFGLKLKAIRNGARGTVPASMPELGWSGMISVSGQARWMEPSGDWQVLSKDEHGPVVLMRRIGKGEVIAVSDPRLASNQNLPRAQNLRFVLALILGNRSPSEILFDEYHHGHVLSDSLAGYVGSSVFSWLILQAFIGTVLYFYSRRAMRAGRFLSLEAQKGRSSLEYVQSMAHIFESCKASSAALEAVLARVEGKLARKIGPQPTGVHLAGALRSTDIPPSQAEEVAHLLAECRQAVRAADEPDRALTLAQKLAVVRSRIDRFRRTELRPIRRAMR